MSEILYRPPKTKSDLGFVLKSFIRTFAKSPHSGPYPRKHLVRCIRDSVADLLRDPATRVTLACNPQDPDQIYGFVCYDVDREFPVLHAVYVKDMFRKMGIGSDLVAIARGSRKGVMRYTHKTPVCNKFLPHALYRPGLVRRRKRRDVSGDTGSKAAA